MSNGTVLRDVGETLKQFVKSNIPEFQDDNCISFNSPADMETATAPRLSLFLYQVTENAYLRNGEREYVAGTDNQMEYPPLTLDLYYLMTPYAQNRETELIILERLLGLFHNQAVLQGTALQGNLAADGNEQLRVVPHHLTLEELNKLWERFSNKSFKLSASYRVTPVRIPSGKTETVVKVEQRKIVLHQGADIEKSPVLEEYIPKT
jgi:hypothetical protein